MKLLRTTALATLLSVAGCVGTSDVPDTSSELLLAPHAIMQYNAEHATRITLLNGQPVLYDGDGRVKSLNGQPVLYDGDGRVKSLNGQPVLYDANGRMTSMGGNPVQYQKE